MPVTARRGARLALAGAGRPPRGNASGHAYFDDDGGAAAKKNELKPFLEPTQWVIQTARNAAFIYQMEQVLDLYEQPYNTDYPVVCLDESPKQLIEQQIFAAANGQRCHDSAHVWRGRVVRGHRTAAWLARVVRRGRPLCRHVGALCGPADGYDLPRRQKSALGHGQPRHAQGQLFLRPFPPRRSPSVPAADGNRLHGVVQ